MFPDPQSLLSISDKGFNPALSVLDNLIGLRQQGYTHLHFSHKWTHPEPLSSEELALWQDALAQSGIKVLDSHGCHPKNMNFWSNDAATRRAAVERMEHRLEVTAALGGDAVVYHVPCHVEPTDQVLRWFIEGLTRVEDKARSLSLKIALENHYLLENDRSALELAFATFSEDYIGFTFDPGHGLISGNTEWLLQNCANRLCCLHLNDNDSRHDNHWLPLDQNGKANWNAIMAFIARSQYHKPLQLEVYRWPDYSATYEDFWAQGLQAAIQLSKIR